MFKISLEEFEGPLDLLLFFLKRDELDIYNIPISRITTEFISYIGDVKSLNFEMAAEFIYMAAMLMSIKAKMLLPHPTEDVIETDEFDPRTELVQRLLEYQMIKEATAALDQLAGTRENLFSRGLLENFEPEVVDDFDEPLHRPTLYNLMLAYKSVMDNRPRSMTRNVMDAPVTVEEQIVLILSKLDAQKQLMFSSVLEGITERIILVVTFLAVLEMCKDGRIVVLVKDDYDELWIAKRAGL
ncbi:MAG: segregation/condensation protein A [Chlorobiaceae bacterium]